MIIVVSAIVIAPGLNALMPNSAPPWKDDLQGKVIILAGVVVALGIGVKLSSMAGSWCGWGQMQMRELPVQLKEVPIQIEELPVQIEEFPVTGPVHKNFK